MANASITVRCPSCRGLAGVDRESIGVPVACPFCGGTFAAVPDVPVVKPVKPTTVVREIPLVYPPRRPVVAEIDPEHIEPTADRTLVFALALLPLAIPLAWAGLLAMGKWQPLFTIGVPIGIGIGTTLLSLGAAWTRDWSNATRIKAAFAVVLLGFGSAAGLFFLKKDWAEWVRKQFGKDEFGWQLYNAGAFQVKFPGRWKTEADPAFADWNLESVRYVDPKLGGERYRVTYGGPPDPLAKLTDEQWFEALKDKLSTPETGEPNRQTDLVQQGFPGREYAFTKPDGATNLTVRVYRVGAAMIALSVEGALLPADARDVTTFFRSLYVTVK